MKSFNKYPWGTAGAALVLTALVAGCAPGQGGVAAAAPMRAETGPGADYPVVVGAAYTVMGVTYTPEDVLNYDEVGLLAADAAGDGAISAAHHTLPLPSYAEVTSLESGRTILVRVERRGPMDGNQLIALSPGAMAQLGAGPGIPVRVRRVNPPEDHRSLLRAGNAAPLRMETPMALVQVLKRKLPVEAAPPPADSGAPTGEPEQVALPPAVAAEPPTGGQRAETARAPNPAAEVAQTAKFIVQAAAFSSRERATAAASALGGRVTQAGAFWRVRTGPFASRPDAQASLAKVKAAGYSDARILTTG